MEAGVVHRVEGSLNGPLGDYCTGGPDARGSASSATAAAGRRSRTARSTSTSRSIAAPYADPFGNADGVARPVCLRSLGFALADSLYADRVIVVTDHLVPFPCDPVADPGQQRGPCRVRRIGSAIRPRSSPARPRSREPRIGCSSPNGRPDSCGTPGIMQEGFSFQAGAGGIALAFAIYLKEMMKRRRAMRARFVRGGSTKYTGGDAAGGPDRLHSWTARPFDLDGVASMRDDPGHAGDQPLHRRTTITQGVASRSFVDVVVAERDRGGRELQRQRRDALRRPGSCTGSAAGGTALRREAARCLAVPAMRDRIR